MCLHVHAVHNHSRLPVMAHVSGTCMKDSFKLKHLLGSTASLFCFWYIPYANKYWWLHTIWGVILNVLYLYPITFRMSFSSCVQWWCWHIWHLKSLWPINLIRLWIRLSIKVIRGWVQRVVIFPSQLPWTLR